MRLFSDNIVIEVTERILPGLTKLIAGLSLITIPIITIAIIGFDVIICAL